MNLSQKQICFTLLGLISPTEQLRGEALLIARTLLLVNPEIYCNTTSAHGK